MSMLPFFCISPFVFISPPLASMAKGVHRPVPGIAKQCSLVFSPPVNMHNPRTCLYAWSNHPFSFEFILQPHELKVC